MNNYGIPDKDLENIRKRDKYCVYCHKTMANPSDGSSRGDWATIEHLTNLPPWSDHSNVAICCFSCNASKGIKNISDWFKTNYCIERNINQATVAKPVQEYIENLAIN